MASDNWLLLTCGVGSKDFEQAGDRLVADAESFGVFRKLHNVKTAELHEILPKLQQWYSLTELESLKGYGWYVWKSSIARLAFEGHWGNFDGVMYLDSGCEIFLSSFSRRRLISYIENAEIRGQTLFAIPTPEVWYTKRDVFERLPFSEKYFNTSQFQSGSWLFKNDLGLQVSRIWENLSWENKKFTDESPSVLPEYPDFKVNRYDQSIFSLVCKEMELTPIREIPPGSATSFRGKVRGFIYPFWWARNRSGNSYVPRYLSSLGKFTIFFSRLFQIKGSGNQVVQE